MQRHGVKRSLAIFISIFMVLSVFPCGALTAFAEDGAAAGDWA